MARDEQIVRGWRPPRCPEADMKFPGKLGHRGSERVHIDRGEEIVYASPSARIRRSLPELPGRQCRHLDGAAASFRLKEFRRSRHATEMVNQDAGVDDDTRHQPRRYCRARGATTTVSVSRL